MDEIKWSKQLEDEVIELFKELIRIDTSNPGRCELGAVRFLQRILEKEEIENRVIESEPGRANLIAKLDGGSQPPILLISHLDVAPVDACQWRFPPFAAIEQEGMIWGRGTLDTKQLTIMELVSFLLLKRSGKGFNRDIYLIATADEENGSRFGMEYLVKHYPEYLPKGYVINEGGGFCIPYQGKNYMIYTAGEKGSCKVRLTANGTGGHASVPPEEQAMGKMAEAIKRLAEYRFSPQLTKISSQLLQTIGITPRKDELGEQLINDPVDSTMERLFHYLIYSDLSINHIEIGQRINVIPSYAQAEVEFRILPCVTKKQIENLLARLLDECDVEWKIESFEEGFESNIEAEIIGIFRSKLKQLAPDIELIPIYALGRTDGRFLGRDGSDVYGISPLLPDLPFSQVLQKVHSQDESITVNSLLFGSKLLSALLLQYCLE